MIGSLARGHRPTVAKVDLRSIAHNFDLLKKSIAADFVCPMVKANAYGHGDIEVAKKLRAVGAKHLGVGLVEEGMRLRDHGDTGYILQFGMFDQLAADAMVTKHITPVVSSLETLTIWINIAEKLARKSLLKSPLGFHLKVNTGMNRLGLDPKDVSVAAKIISASPRLIRLEGLATHFSDGEDFGVAGGRTDRQLQCFRAAEREIRATGITGFHLHVANSSATRAMIALRKSDPSTDSIYGDLGIRPGLSIYGVEPEMANCPPIGVRPVLTFESQIVHLQNVHPGERVSYAGKWQALGPSRIGVIPCGYADGYRRGITGGSILVRGHLAPIVGTICMDYFMCDLTEVQDAKLHDVVTLLGSDQENGRLTISAAELAGRVQTIPYEIFTGISERVPRLYVDDAPTLGIP